MNALERIIRNLANVSVEELSDYRAKQELTDFVNAARCLIKIIDDNNGEDNNYA